MVHTENNFKNENKEVNMRDSQREISVSKTNLYQRRDLTRNDNQDTKVRISKKRQKNEVKKNEPKEVKKKEIKKKRRRKGKWRSRNATRIEREREGEKDK